jgi:hypothetical protein
MHAITTTRLKWKAPSHSDSATRVRTGEEASSAAVPARNTLHLDNPPFSSLPCFIFVVAARYIGNLGLRYIGGLVQLCVAIIYTRIGVSIYYSLRPKLRLISTFLESGTISCLTNLYNKIIAFVISNKYL